MITTLRRRCAYRCADENPRAGNGRGTGLRRPRHGVLTHHGGLRRDDHRAGTADLGVDAYTVDHQPGFPGIPGLPHIPGLPQIPGFPIPGNTNVPEVPAPANWETMKCSEYTKLDEAEQRAVIKAILEEQGGAAGVPSPR